MKMNALAYLFLSAIAVVPGTLAHDYDSPAEIMQTYKYPLEYEVLGADGQPRHPPLEEDETWYNPTFNIISGLKVFKNKLFLNIPRFFGGGVPATIVVVDGKKSSYYEQPKLTAWPSWEWHNPVNCAGDNTHPGHGIAFSMGTEVVPPNAEFVKSGYDFYTLWVLDTGVTNVFDPSIKKEYCDPSVIIFNIETGVMVDRFYLPGDVAVPFNNFLNDIVVDHTTGWCYISDNNGNSREGEGGVIAAHVGLKKATRVWGETMFPQTATNRIINGDIRYALNNPVNSIALQPDGKYVYYAPATSFIVYMIPTEVMQNDELSVKDRHDHVEVVGNKGTGSGSMKFASNGTMFYTAHHDDGIRAWTWGRGSLDQTNWIAYQDHEEMQWQDQLDFDEKGYDTYNPDGSNLWFVTNELLRFFNFAGEQDWKVNLWKAEVGTTDYFDALEITSNEGTVPVTTVLTSNFNVVTPDKSRDSYGNGPYGYNSGYNSYGDTYYKKASKSKKGKSKKGKSKGKTDKGKKYYSPKPHYGYTPEPYYGYTPEPYYGYSPDPHYGYEPGYDRQQPYYGGDY